MSGLESATGMTCVALPIRHVLVCLDNIKGFCPLQIDKAVNGNSTDTQHHSEDTSLQYKHMAKKRKTPTKNEMKLELQANLKSRKDLRSLNSMPLDDETTQGIIGLGQP